jgi:hypothetical protein
VENHRVVIKRLLRTKLPEAILRLTEGAAFDAPAIPPLEDVADRAGTGEDALRDVLKGFRDAAADMNTRCNTAGPTASLVGVVGAVLKDQLHEADWLYVVVLALAAVAVFAALTGLSIAIPFNRIGLQPRTQDVAAERSALLRKEAWARVATSMANVAMLALVVTAVWSAIRD